MKCPNCGAKINKEDICPECGIKLAPYIRAENLSAHYYNKGLEMAADRDLSGAIKILRKSISFNSRRLL